MSEDTWSMRFIPDEPLLQVRRALSSPEPITLLAGDIGHTKILMGLFERDDGGWRILRTESYSSVECTGLEPIIEQFLARQTAKITAACFGVAGPVLEGRCRPTDLTWEVTTSSLRALLKTPDVLLINDLAALAYSLPWLQREQILTLQEGVERSGNRAVVAAGTGLGECTLFWDGVTHHPSACEGGHTDFGSRNEWEVGLWRFLSRRYEGHVSYSRIVSGRGLVNLFDYVVSTGVTPAASVQAARTSEPDPTPTIVTAGLKGSCAACAEALDHFLELYGAEAGNVTLKSLAVGGLYVGGGIAPRILDRLRDGRFLQSFHDKGRFRRLLEEVPVRVILEPKAALLGALRRATLLLAG